jgi:hypothetical protein
MHADQDTYSHIYADQDTYSHIHADQDAYIRTAIESDSSPLPIELGKPARWGILWRRNEGGDVTMAIRQSIGPERVFLRQRKLPAQRTDLVRWHMGRPSSSDPLGDTGNEMAIARLPVYGKPIGHRLLRLERGHQAEERGQARSGRRSRVPQPDLVLLLVWVQDKANVYTGATNTNARAAKGDPDVTTLSSTTHTAAFTLSRTAHVHTASLVEQHSRQHPRTQRQPGP